MYTWRLKLFINRKLKLGSGPYFLVLPFSAAGIIKIFPKGPYNTFFFVYIIISLSPLSLSTNSSHTRMRNFVFWSVYDSTTCFKIVNNAKRKFFVAVISGMIGSHCGFRAFLGEN